MALKKNPTDNCQYIAYAVCTPSVSPQHNWSLSNSIHNKWATDRWSFPLMATQFHQHHRSMHITNVFIYCYIHKTAMVYACDPASSSVAFFNTNTVATIQNPVFWIIKIHNLSILTRICYTLPCKQARNGLNWTIIPWSLYTIWKINISSHSFLRLEWCCQQFWLHYGTKR